jgi:NAD(P)-dependent dehydrogenase (short-subunit alcohol dehydrogenase family)
MVEYIDGKTSLVLGLFVERKSRSVIISVASALQSGEIVRLEGRVALVTGAAMGIGKGIASLFAQHGAKVIAADINAQAGKVAAEEIRGTGAQCIFQHTDVSAEPEVKAAVATAQKEFGQTIDVLANVAGIAHESPAHLLALADWNRILSVNLTSMFLCAKHVLPGMIAAKRGSIVNITSVQGLFGFPGYPHYAASKGGVISLTRQLAREYAKHGVRVNCIAPGTVETPMNVQVLERVPNPAGLRRAWERMHPLGRIGQPIDIAWGALFLASDESSWTTGQCLSIDGGISCSVLPE